MKFDTPATTNPIDQLKVVGKPTDRIDGPLKTTGTRALRLRAARCRAEPGLRLRRRLGDRQGAHQRDRRDSRQGGARRPRDRDDARYAASSDEGRMNYRLPVRRPGDPALPPGDRDRGRGDLRAGSRGRLPDPRRLRPRAGQVRPRRRGETAPLVGAEQRRRQRRRRRVDRVGDFEAPSRRRRSSSTRPTRRPTRATP